MRIKAIVKPNSRNTAMKWDPDKLAYKISLKSPAKDGKANIELVKMLSRKLKKKVTIISGATSKTKILRAD